MKRLFLIFLRIGRADLRLVRIAMKHPDRPRWLLPALIILGLYALAPFSMVIPVLGLIDDFVLVPLALHFLLTLLPASIRLNRSSH